MRFPSAGIPRTKGLEKRRLPADFKGSGGRKILSPGDASSELFGASALLHILRLSQTRLPPANFSTASNTDC
jgi:hypothetical protein